MEALRKEMNYTTEDIYALPEGQRAELINGQMYLMAPPTTRHQAIVFFTARKIADYIDRKGGDCRVFPAPFAVFLNDNNKTYVEPDVSVICDREKLDAFGCNGAPDWVIEVVSPSSHRMDYMIKLFKYSSAGVREYWIIDPAKDRILVYNFQANTFDEYSLQSTVKSGIYEDLEIDFSNLAD